MGENGDRSVASGSGAPAADEAPAGAAPTSAGAAGPATADPQSVRCCDDLQASVDRVTGRSIDELADPALQLELRTVTDAVRQLTARATLVTGALAARREQQIAAGGDDRPVPDNAADQALDGLARDLREQLGITIGESKRAGKVGRALQERVDPAVREAYEQGRISERNATILVETIATLDTLEAAEASLSLLDAAIDQEPRTFSRTCRQRLVELDAAAAEQAEQRRRARRTAKLWQRDDGFQALSFAAAGLDGEIVATAVHAFRRPDSPGHPRTTEQATADAVVAMAQAALDAGSAPRRHEVRPHVIVTIDYQELLAGRGMAETAWSGPVPFEEIRRLLTDCDVSRLLVSRDSLPVEAGPAVRTVPRGLARALRERDRECIHVSCDVPVDWTDVMHLGRPYRFEGLLSLETAGLGCREHHRAFDDGLLALTWVGGRPYLHAPDLDDDEVRRRIGVIRARHRAGPGEASGQDVARERRGVWSTGGARGSGGGARPRRALGVTSGVAAVRRRARSPAAPVRAGGRPTDRPWRGSGGQ